MRFLKPIPVALDLRVFECGDRGFETRQGHVCCSLVFIMCYLCSRPYDELITRSEKHYRVCVCVCDCVWFINVTYKADKALVELSQKKNDSHNLPGLLP